MHNHCSVLRQSFATRHNHVILAAVLLNIMSTALQAGRRETDKHLHSHLVSVLIITGWNRLSCLISVEHALPMRSGQLRAYEVAPGEVLRQLHAAQHNTRHNAGCVMHACFTCSRKSRAAAPYSITLQAVTCRPYHTLQQPIRLQETVMTSL
jgi:hypothetical protein